MFPYTTPNTFSPAQNPRDKYLAALVMAKEAEQEYLTAEAALEFEEHALRRRLEELELEKHRLRGVPSEAVGRLSALVGVSPAQSIEQQNVYRRQGAMGAARLATKHYHQLEARRSRPDARNDAFIQVCYGVRLYQSLCSDYSFQSPPSFPYAFGSDTILPIGPSVGYPVSPSIHNPHAFLQRSPPFGEHARFVQFAPASAARVEAPKHRPCVGNMQDERYALGHPVPRFAVQAKAAVSTNNPHTAEAPALNDDIIQLLRAQARADILTNNNGTADASALNATVVQHRLLRAQARADMSANNSDPADASALNAAVVQRQLLRAMHAAGVKASPVAPPSSAPSTSKTTEMVPESKKIETEPQQPSHITVEECLGAMLGHVAQIVEASASPASNTTSGSAPVKTSEVESSLKAELEARLNNDQSNEIKDTIHAIFASLSDAHSNAPSSSIKGKEKAHPISAKVMKDVASSIEAVRTVNVALRTLQSEFVFPVQLDFTPAPSPASSDSERSLTGRLAYTSRNAPVRYYEQSLSGLLAQLDSIESFGHEDLRKLRKSVVEAVESALEELEREVEGRWRSKTAMEAAVAAEQDAVKAEVTEKIVTSEVVAPAESAKGDELAPVDAPTPIEAVVVGEDEVAAVDATLETFVATPQAEPTELLVVSDIVSESSASVTEHPLPASVDAPTSAYSPSSASIDTVRPYDVESQSSEDPQEPFLLSEDNSADQETATKKKVDDDTGSDWSEVEA
ncbi:hypothetical protein IW261DRAFT_1471422 [Armillaria novae-zelandiae]|uniref:BAG domain-containing protein n=1 Tax=Armillaria novae-zelandiae TaxID=153914 RepID=A0AA39PCC7_9AGAR|nr:hypothetical protein IW261DRAFT_1471422 [Armillaria novae-zelandiae]